MQLAEHSPLGASGAYRWMECPASVGLSKGISDSESEFAAEGTAAHHLAQACLGDGTDAWEYIGQETDKGYVATKDMADAVQVYLDAIRQRHPDRHESNTFIEKRFHCPDIHESFYGQADFVYIDMATSTLHVYDYKHGAGIVVDVQDNPQCMYYGVGMLTELSLWDDIETVVLHIAQPRGFHFDGPLREWAISTGDLYNWLHDVLVPAMDRALGSTWTQSGEHCRFCPVRSRACPQLIADFDELEELMNIVADKGGAKALSNAQLGRFLTLFDVAKIVQKQAQETAFQRLQAGKKVPGRKLANARTNREWKDGADKALAKAFGDDALSEPKLLSPAKIDAFPGGKAATARWAFKPDGGLTVVAQGDARVAVSKDTKSLFKDVTKGKK